MSFCHFKLTITNLLVLSVVAALFLSLFSGFLINAQAQDALDPALFPASRKGSTATITATDAAGTTITSYSNSTDLIKIPMTWTHTRRITGSTSVTVELATFYESKDIELVRFEGSETDQTVYTRVGQDPPIYLFSRPANDLPAAYCDSTPTAASFCSEGSPGGTCATDHGDDEEAGEFCSGGADPTHCADGSAADGSGFCPAEVNVLTWPQQRNYFTGADAHVKAGSADLTAYNAGNSISDVETRIALTCPLVNGRYQCTYGGVILYNALASITSAKMYIGDVGKSVASGPWCEQIIGFSKVRAPGARIDPGSLADIDTQIKNAFAASPRTHPGAIVVGDADYCAGVSIFAARIAENDRQNNPAGTHPMGTIVIRPKADISGPITLRVGGYESFGDSTVNPPNTEKRRIPMSAALTIADAKAPTITTPATGNLTVTSGVFPITTSEDVTVSMVCGSETAILDTDSAAGNQDTVTGGTATDVTIVSGLTGGSKAGCVVTIADTATTPNTATRNVATFTFNDSTDPSLDSVTAERTSTNADAFSTKYAKSGDTVTVSLNFSEPIVSLTDVAIKVGGSSGTAISTPAVVTAPATGAGALSTVQYTFTVPASVNGSVYVSANNFTDESSNAVSTAETQETTTSDDQLSSFFVVDTTVPTAPAAPVLATASDTGHSTSDKKTNDDMPTITVDVGTGERAKVVATKGADSETETRTGDGDVEFSTALADGSWVIEVTALDKAGNSTDSGSPITVVIDTEVPTGASVTLSTAAPFASSNTYINSAESTANSSSTLVGTATATGHRAASDQFTTIAASGTCDSSTTGYDTKTNTQVSDVTSDGSYKVCYQATDESGNSAYATSPTFKRDTTDPTITIISLGSDNYSVSTSDANGVDSTGSADIASSSAACDSSVTFTAVSSGTFSATNYPCVKVTDNAGNIAYSKTFIEGSPITGVGVSAEAAGSKLINSQTFNVYGTGQDNATVTVKRRATAGSGSYDTDLGTATVSSGTWTFAVTLTADGTYDFATTTRLADNTDLSTPVPYTGVVVDTTAPTASLSGQAPASAAVSNAASVTATVAGTDVTHYRYKVVAGSSCSGSTGYLPNDTTGTAVATGISAATTTPADGSVSLCVIGRDEAGNWQSTSSATEHTWTKDTTDPTVVIVHLGSTNYSVSPSDANGVASTESADIASSGATCDSTVTFSTVSSGAFTATNHPCVKVTDNAGNIAYSKTFVQGSSITGIGVGANVAGSKVVNGRTFSVYGTGPEGATVTLKRRATAGSGAYSTDLGTATISSGAWSISVTVSTDGTYDFATTTRLSGGTELSTPVPYTGVVVDTVAPTATLSGQAPASAAVSSATSVTATVAGTDVTHYRYKVVAGASCNESTGYRPNNTTGTAVATGISAATTAPADGSVSLCVIGRDEAGNWQSLSSATKHTWTKDTTDPTVTIIHLGSTNYSVASSDANGVATTESADIASAGATCDSSVSFATVSSGTFTAANHPCVKVTDNAGNIAYSKTFVQGSSITGIGVTAEAAGSKLIDSRAFNVYGTGPEGATVTLKRRATAGSGAYATNLGTTTVSSGAWSISITVTADGTYDFATTTRLSGGTELSTPVPYTGVVVDTVPPTATLSGQAPASAAVSNAASVTATVAGTDVTHYRYKVVAGASCSGSTGYLPNDTVGTAIATGISAATTTPADGSVSLCVIGKDAAGNWQSTSSATKHTWTKDTTDPTITITQLTSTTYAVSASDANGVASTESANIANAGATCSSSASFSTVSSGTFTAATHPCVKATDNAGNIAYSKTFTQGSAITGIGVSSETVGSKIINSRTFNVYGTGPDNATVTLKRRATAGSGAYTNTLGTATVSSGAWSISITVSADGTYDFATTTQLPGGTSLNTPVPYTGVVVDTTAPTVTLSTPVTAAGAGSNTRVTATVSGAGVTHYRYKLVAGSSCGGSTGYLPNDTVGTAVGTGISADILNSLTYSNNGQITVCAIGRDAAGNWQSVATSKTTTIEDSEIPTVSSVTSSGGTGSATITFTAGAMQSNEPFTVVLSGSCSALGTKTERGPGVKTVTYSLNLSETYSNCTIVLRDLAGNASAAAPVPSFSVSRRRSGGGGSRPGFSGSTIAPVFPGTTTPAVTSPTSPIVVPTPPPSATRPIVAPAPIASFPTYRRGDRGIAVRTIQRNMNRLGYVVAQSGPGSPGHETDYFGPATERAVKSFQRSASLAQTGVFDSATRYAVQRRILARLRERIMEITLLLQRLRAQ